MDEDNRIAWVPAGFLAGYDGYCPIQQVHGAIDEEAPDQFRFFNMYSTEDAFAVEATMPAERVIWDPGFLVLELGSVDEDLARSTAADAIYSSLVSLFAACSPNVQFERVRTSVELVEVMRARGHNWSHIIVVGHGGEEGLTLLDRPSPVTGQELGGLLSGGSAVEHQTQVISLCCYSGCSAVSMALSRTENITEVVAPDGAFDLRWAVVFVTGYFLKLLNSRKPVEQAVAEAAHWCDALPVVVWRDGLVLSGDPSVPALA